ncbi:hypothetical protein D0T49_11015 [Paludibacter sp. 221]|uniref:hypothetical protein n=1 Tax=Paludibacter sp. 221 TaxID=2302939 RepID=UPI0013D1F72A|nr:hypothetical protein [Paludibacter sp. 221]NDV47578.1 hypothetical protein [Paludibacter sp. 221]
MKKTLTRILAFVCAVYFLTAGLGFNVVHYCCDTCASEGIEAVANKSCEAIHHEHEHEDGCCHHAPSATREDMACSDASHTTDGCHLLRMSTDMPSVVAGVDITPADFGQFIDLPYIIISSLFELDNPFWDKPSFTPPDDVPLLSGRDILAYHAVLLI